MFIVGVGTAAYQTNIVVTRSITQRPNGVRSGFSIARYRWVYPQAGQPELLAVWEAFLGPRASYY